MAEELKKFAEKVTGAGRPKAGEIGIRNRQPHAFAFADDGETPNNPDLALVVYRSPVVLDSRLDPAAIFEELFAAHGWEESWRDAMYDFNHFHSRAHECLGIARGKLTALFGGRKGRKIELKAGDLVVIPAGVGHRCIRKSKDLLIVGAYPPNGGKYDEPKPGEIADAVVRDRIRKVPLPATDPAYGENGPLFSIWRRH
ncbi:MAG TPA: cupin domain-containing protein [Rhizomicrobium sp.]|nr:cupin domain-containing protein [Rhizomicrobium sp.]